MRALRVAWLAVLGGCALFPSLEDLGGDAAVTEAGSDAPADAPAKDGGADVSVADALADVALDAPVDADAGPSCGWPGPTTGLVAYYPFEEGQGSAVHDCAANHLDGTFVQQAAWTTGKKGGGIALSSSAGCVDLGAPPQFQLSTFTVTAWLEISGLPSVGASGYVVGQAINADVSGWRVGTIQTDAGGFVQWDQTVSGTHYRVAAAAPPLSSWHAMAMVFVPGGTTALYLDGALASSQPGFPAIAYDGADMRIGCRSDGNNSFNGVIDEVRIYDRALTSSEITSLAQ